MARYILSGLLLIAFFLLYGSSLTVFRGNWALWAAAGFVGVLIFSTVMNGGDLEGAFSAAHALKGSTGNLSLTPIFAPVCEIVELLRNRTDTDYTELVEMIRKGRDELQRICEN